MNTNYHPMQIALQQARFAYEHDEVPIGAVIVSSEGTIIAQQGNQMRQLCDPTAHAEIQVLRIAAQKIGNERLINCDLYVTLEPCTMCAAAISLARIRRIYFGAEDKKTGAVENGIHFFSQPTCHHKPEIYGGIEEKQSRLLLEKFFKEKRSALSTSK